MARGERKESERETGGYGVIESERGAWGKRPYRQMDGCTDDSLSDTHRDTETETQRHRDTDAQNTQTHRHIDTQTYRHTDIQTQTQTHRHTHTLEHTADYR